MNERLLSRHSHDSLSELPVVVISGPRQAGKTTLAKALLSIIRVIEIKFNSAPVLGKGFYYAHEDFGRSPVSVIYFGDETYTLKPNVQVISIGEFLRHLSGQT